MALARGGYDDDDNAFVCGHNGGCDCAVTSNAVTYPRWTVRHWNNPRPTNSARPPVGGPGPAHVLVAAHTSRELCAHRQTPFPTSHSGPVAYNLSQIAIGTRVLGTEHLFLPRHVIARATQLFRLRSGRGQRCGRDDLRDEDKDVDQETCLALRTCLPWLSMLGLLRWTVFGTVVMGWLGGAAGRGACKPLGRGLGEFEVDRDEAFWGLRCFRWNDGENCVGPAFSYAGLRLAGYSRLPLLLDGGIDHDCANAHRSGSPSTTVARKMRLENIFLCFVPDVANYGECSVLPNSVRRISQPVFLVLVLATDGICGYLDRWRPARRDSAKVPTTRTRAGANSIVTPVDLKEERASCRIRSGCLNEDVVVFVEFIVSTVHWIITRRISDPCLLLRGCFTLGDAGVDIPAGHQRIPAPPPGGVSELFLRVFEQLAFSFRVAVFISVSASGLSSFSSSTGSFSSFHTRSHNQRSPSSPYSAAPSPRTLPVSPQPGVPNPTTVTTPATANLSRGDSVQASAHIFLRSVLTRRSATGPALIASVIVGVVLVLLVGGLLFNFVRTQRKRRRWVDMEKGMGQSRAQGRVGLGGGGGRLHPAPLQIVKEKPSQAPGHSVASSLDSARIVVIAPTPNGTKGFRTAIVDKALPPPPLTDSEAPISRPLLAHLKIDRPSRGASGSSGSLQRSQTQSTNGNGSGSGSGTNTHSSPSSASDIQDTQRLTRGLSFVPHRGTTVQSRPASQSSLGTIGSAITVANTTRSKSFVSRGGRPGVQRSQSRASTKTQTTAEASPISPIDIAVVQRFTRGLSFGPRGSSNMAPSRPASRSSLGTLGTEHTLGTTVDLARSRRASAVSLPLAARERTTSMAEMEVPPLPTRPRSVQLLQMRTPATPPSLVSSPSPRRRTHNGALWSPDPSPRWEQQFSQAQEAPPVLESEAASEEIDSPNAIVETPFTTLEPKLAIWTLSRPPVPSSTRHLSIAVPAQSRSTRSSRDRRRTHNGTLWSPEPSPRWGIDFASAQAQRIAEIGVPVADPAAIPLPESPHLGWASELSIASVAEIETDPVAIPLPDSPLDPDASSSPSRSPTPIRLLSSPDITEFISPSEAVPTGRPETLMPGPARRTLPPVPVPPPRQGQRWRRTGNQLQGPGRVQGARGQRQIGVRRE
uniref:Uncharacterized protein n=1 Tax=Mycena chlorophos TaxID=658473 RepID=A0ABQ0KVB6_MYCCL|nr:predicted protein [Mycena chlorophos]